MQATMIYVTVRNTIGGYPRQQLKDLIGEITVIRLFGYKYFPSVYSYLEFFRLGIGEHTTAEIPEEIDFIRIGCPFRSGVNFENLQRKFGSLEDKYKNTKVLISNGSHD